MVHIFSILPYKESSCYFLTIITPFTILPTNDFCVFQLHYCSLFPLNNDFVIYTSFCIHPTTNPAVNNTQLYYIITVYISPIRYSISCRIYYNHCPIIIAKQSLILDTDSLYTCSPISFILFPISIFDFIYVHHLLYFH